MYESASQTDNAALIESVIDLLGTGRAGLVTDVDGTISPIVARPDEARVLPEARAALHRLHGVLTLVAVVSGRTAADARSMVGIDGLTYVGNHGLEVLGECGPEVVPAALVWVPRIAAVLEAVRAQVRQPGIFVEAKGATASLHYRQAADRKLARQELLDILAPIVRASGLQVHEGRMVINLVPPIEISKGSAIRRLVSEHRLEQLVYLGDDETDAYALRAVRALRESGDVRSLGIAVVDDETPAHLRELADADLPSVEAVSELLTRVAEELNPDEC